MKRVISTPWFVLLFGYVMLLALASAEVPGVVKNATIPHRQRHRVPRRFGGTNQHGSSRPVKGVYRPDDESNESFNWAGAWQVNIPGGTGLFNAVTAQWQIPDVTLPLDGPPYEIWEVTAFIGIDGNEDNCPPLFQAGTTTYALLDANGNLQIEVVAFAEWYPTPEVELTGMDVYVGDIVTVTLQASSLSQGTVEFINVSEGTSTTASLSAASADENICGLTAVWIVENSPLADGSGPAPFLPFSPYNFESCAAGTTSGNTTDLIDAQQILMFDNDTMQYLAYPTIVNKNLLTVTYGPPPGN